MNTRRNPPNYVTRTSYGGCVYSQFQCWILIHLQRLRVYGCVTCGTLNNQFESVMKMRCVFLTVGTVSKSFRTGRLERELKMVQLFATRCSCIAISWVSLATFTAITLCVTSQRVVPKVSVYFVIDSVRKLLDTPSYYLRHLLSIWNGSWVPEGLSAETDWLTISCKVSLTLQLKCRM
jgi:hypothetical protein